MLANTFTEPFGRIFWKEYRVHRALWLSCLAIGFLILVFITSLMSGSDGRNQGLMAMVAFMPAMYAIGAGALLFAGEREERTSDWLLAIAAPPVPTVVAKLVFAILSTYALQVALVPISLGLMSNEPMGSQDLWQMYIPHALLVLVWALFGSLLSRRVLMSVPAMTLWWVVTYIWPSSLLQAWRRSAGLPFSTGMDNMDARLLYCIVVAVIAADLWLGWRWCQGRYLDASVFENLNAVWERGRSRLVPRMLLSSPVSTRAESETSWRRTWQRLVWQERRRESLHLVMLATGCVMAISAIIGSRLAREPSMTFWLFLMFTIPVAMGVLGFRVDTARQQSRFLANRGVSPESVWLAKQAVWLPRAFWISGVVFLLSVFLDWIFVDPNRIDFIGETPLQHLFAATKSHPQRAIWFILLSYGCGQLAAVLFQRVVLAIGVGIVLNFVCGFWQASMEALVIPQWWSLGIPVVAMLGITLWQMKPWMLEDHSWRQRCRQFAALGMTSIVLLVLLAGYRVAEAMITTDFHTNPVFETLATQLKSQTLTPDEEVVNARISDLRSMPAIPDTQIANEIVQLMKRNVSHINVVDRDEDSLPASNELALSIAQVDRNKHAFKRNSIPNALLKCVDERTTAGQLDQALIEILAGLKLDRLETVRNRFPPMWEYHSIIQKMMLEKAVIWANHPSQTPDSIRDARRKIQAELNLFPSATEVIVAHYLHERRLWIVSSRQEVLNELLGVRGQYLAPLILAIVLSPPERDRLDRLIKLQSQAAFYATTILESHITSPLYSAKKILSQFSGDDVSAALARTTVLSRMTNISTYSILRSVIDRHAMMRAALTRMELIAYRLEHGKLPESLVELMGSIDQIQLIDPWSSRLFEYYPAFLMTSGTQETVLVPVSASELGFIEAGGMQPPWFDPAQLISQTQEAEAAITAKLKGDVSISSSIFLIPPKPATEPE